MVAAVKKLVEKLNSFCEDKESVRAEGSVDKLIVVLALPSVAARSGPATPPAINNPIYIRHRARAIPTTNNRFSALLLAVA